MMNIKQRVFTNIAMQIPFGSNKMTSKANAICPIYANELKQDKNKVAEAAKLCEKQFGHKFDVDNINDLIIINMTLNNQAYDEVAEVRDELVNEGYLRKWSTKAKFGIMNCYGLTAKGWKYAQRYIEMAKKEKEMN